MFISNDMLSLVYFRVVVFNSFSYALDFVNIESAVGKSFGSRGKPRGCASGPRLAMSFFWCCCTGTPSTKAELAVVADEDPAADAADTASFVGQPFQAIVAKSVVNTTDMFKIDGLEEKENKEPEKKVEAKKKEGSKATGFSIDANWGVELDEISKLKKEFDPIKIDKII